MWNFTIWRFRLFFLTAVTWNGIESRLTLHWENGFLLTRAKTDTETESVLWSHPYERMRSSSDDAKRILWLDFGDKEGEHVCFLKKNYSLFIIHSIWRLREPFVEWDLILVESFTALWVLSFFPKDDFSNCDLSIHFKFMGHHWETFVYQFHISKIKCSRTNTLA